MKIVHLFCIYKQYTNLMSMQANKIGHFNYLSAIVNLNNDLFYVFTTVFYYIVISFCLYTTLHMK